MPAAGRELTGEARKATRSGEAVARAAAVQVQKQFQRTGAKSADRTDRLAFDQHAGAGNRQQAIPRAEGGTARQPQTQRFDGADTSRETRRGGRRSHAANRDRAFPISQHGANQTQQKLRDEIGLRIHQPDHGVLRGVDARVERVGHSARLFVHHQQPDRVARHVAPADGRGGQAFRHHALLWIEVELLHPAVEFRVPRDRPARARVRAGRSAGPAAGAPARGDSGDASGGARTIETPGTMGDLSSTLSKPWETARRLRRNSKHPFSSALKAAAAKIASAMTSIASVPQSATESPSTKRPS